ncbi:coiled-coil domain-containing protein 28B isoform X1 [Photinus pyralis]|uniref:coiled-coil domain-containing protein 28B isoform X1 n=1 Tax=Photinus pyralis TaxID=7054 RepID=UPI00126775B4|nr:coiled-coil domain-containing protein 28B isoform X1 [Photinus pyralis]
MESVGEACELLQQLVPSDPEGDNDDSTVQEEYNINEGKVASPIRSSKVNKVPPSRTLNANLQISSSGATTHSSVSCKVGASSTNSDSKLLYINEKKSNKDYTKASSVRPRHPHKDSGSTAARHHCFLSEVPDVRHMEQALLGLLADFHSGKLKAFGSGSTMEQMTNIREQQERLAKLHFDLATDSDPSLSEEGLRHSRTTMSQLIERLEQLSVSIEGLHTTSNDK